MLRFNVEQCNVLHVVLNVDRLINRYQLLVDNSKARQGWRPFVCIHLACTVTQASCCMCRLPVLQLDAMQHGGRKFVGRHHQQWIGRLPVEMTSCASYVPFWALVRLMLFSQMKPEAGEAVTIHPLNKHKYNMTNKTIEWQTRIAYAQKCSIMISKLSSDVLASIIPVWTAETIKGWNGSSNVDAAIRNFGFSSRSALDKHCKKYVLLKYPHHQILSLISIVGQH